MDSDSESEDLILEDQEVFDDFTVASSWERLISGIEAACQKWETASAVGHLFADAVVVEGDGKLHKVHNELAYGIKSYQLEFFFEIDEPGGRDEWKSGLHHLQLWFGVRDFLVISPVSMSGVILDAPEATLLLSGVAIALCNCGSIWPAFVPVHDPTRKSYKGIQGMKGPYSRSFEADRIGSQVPVKLMHLEGLYDLFLTKLAFSLPDSASNYDGKVRFTMRLTYGTPMPGYEFVQIKNPASPAIESEIDSEHDIAWNVQWDEECPWSGWYSVDDPIKGFELITIWAERIVESSLDMAEFENVSTFEADKWLLAPIITKILDDVKRDEQVSFASRMRALLTAFLLSNEARFMEDFLSSDSTMLQKITSSSTIPPPTVLGRALKDLFEDAPLTSGPGYARSNHENAQFIKGAPTKSLFAQFCLQALWFGSCNICAISALWIEFVREVRWFWDELQPLPRISPDEPPDLDTCLVHQKLQLLAACIKRKSVEQRSFANTILNDKKTSDARDASDSGAVESGHSKANKDNFTELTGPHIERYEQQRQGSIGPEGTLMLLKSCQRLHVPITQEPPVMTEDMLLEREQAIMALSDSPHGKMTQARLQTDMLSSDMAAFKAANPGAVLEDFVRWHSPRDWVEKEEFEDSLDTLVPVGNGTDQEESLESSWPPRGKLSDRMSQQGNLWGQIWGAVEPVPVSQQKPLFDHTREGEKVIHYLETLKPHQLLAQMICTSFSSIADLLYRTKAGELKPLLVEIDKLYLTISSILKPLMKLNVNDVELGENSEDWHTDIMNLCILLENAEKHAIMAASLYQKLPNAPRLFPAVFNNCIRAGRQENISPVVVSTSERETVATLFPPNLSEPWKKGLRMGNFLNGHEPLLREMIFSHFDHYFEGQRDRYKMQRSNTRERILSHRMYIQGTSNDLQVAYSVISDD